VLFLVRRNSNQKKCTAIEQIKHSPGSFKSRCRDCGLKMKEALVGSLGSRGVVIVEAQK